MATLEARHTSTFPIELGPLKEEGTLSAGLDYYKPTMSQLQRKKHPEAEVTFTFKNRGEQRLADYINIDALQSRLDALRHRSWTTEEINYFRSLENSQGERVFKDDFLVHLVCNELPRVDVSFDQAKDDIAIETVGKWSLVTFWETIIMSEVNEAYFENYVRQNKLDLAEVYEEGDHRLSEKIAILKANPGIKFADFGTRRHFSFRWQRHVVERLTKECPENFIGTSNVALARSMELKPIGTFAHEMPMVYAGIADAMGHKIRPSHNHFLEDWYDGYGPDLSIALTDTFKTEFFFSDFTPEQAYKWHGVRHDSGDPFEFGEKLIEFYKDCGIDPQTKTLVFSDGLDIDDIVKLYNHFEGRVNVVFGWGTTLTNDLGIEALSIVAKATHVKIESTKMEADTVKLSDSPNKHTGSEDSVEQYEREFQPIVRADI